MWYIGNNDDDSDESFIVARNEEETDALSISIYLTNFGGTSEPSIHGLTQLMVCGAWCNRAGLGGSKGHQAAI